MRHWRLAAGAGRHNTPLPVPLRAAQSAYHAIAAEGLAGLRQIEEFSPKLARLRRTAYLSAALLLVLVGCCLFLSLRHVDVFALYAAGMVVMLLQIAFAAGDYYLEERRTAQAYRRYLDNFSPEVLAALRRGAALSAWSRLALDRYLAAQRPK